MNKRGGESEGKGVALAPQHRHLSTGTSAQAPQHRHLSTGTSAQAPQHRHLSTGTSAQAKDLKSRKKISIKFRLTTRPCPWNED